MTPKDPEAPCPHRHQMAGMLHYHGCDACLYEIGYAAGFKEGRASRDNLRKALEAMVAESRDKGWGLRIADEALPADEEAGMTPKDPEAPYPHRHQTADMLHYHGCDARLYEIGYAAREDEVSELKARIAELEKEILEATRLLGMSLVDRVKELEKALRKGE